MDYTRDKLKFVACALFVCVIVLSQSMYLFASDDAALLFQNANKSYADLCRDASKKKVRDNWMRVIDGFTSIAEKYPDSSFAPEAYYKSAKVYEHFSRYSGKKSDAAAASQSYQEAARKYPRSGVADKSLLASGLLEEKLGNKAKAQSLYRQIIDDYAQGAVAEQAREKVKGIPSEETVKQKASKEKTADKAPAEKTASKAQADKSADKAPVEKATARAQKDKQTDKSAEKAQSEDQGTRKPGETSLVKKVSCSQGQGSGMRLEVEMDALSGYKTFVIPGNSKENRLYRLVMDIQGSRVSSGIPYTQKVDEGFISAIRISQNPGKKVRVVLDLKEKPYYEASTTNDPARIIIDVNNTNTATNTAAPKSAAAHQSAVKKVPKGSVTQMKDDVPSLATQLCLKVSKIVVDAGHGGKDPGAISPAGVREKDLTLEIAKILAKRLKADGFEVYLTRSRDEFLTLEERTNFANKKRADLFVSLHINSHQNSSVSGIETYFLNLTTDSSAIEVAARENAAAQKSMSDLQLILNDLMLNSKINESSRFANNVQTCVMSSALNTGYEGKNLGVRQAPFYVLLGAQMPSVLIELGFLTNTVDIGMLKKHTYQLTLVDGIAKGINNYIMNTTYAYSWRNK